MTSYWIWYNHSYLALIKIYQLTYLLDLLYCFNCHIIKGLTEHASIAGSFLFLAPRIANPRIFNVKTLPMRADASVGSYPHLLAAR